MSLLEIEELEGLSAPDLTFEEAGALYITACVVATVVFAVT
jgi:hypothetical protein